MSNALVQVNPFSFERRAVEWRDGATLAEFIAEGLPEHIKTSELTATIDGHIIAREYWHVVRPKPGTQLIFKVVPRDNNVLRAVAFIGLAILAPQIGIWAFGSGTLGASILGAGVFAVGALAINALIPPAETEMENGDSISQALSIGASRNRLEPFGTMPLVYGTTRLFPPYAAKPYTELVGDDQYVRMLFVVGFKPMALSNIKLGETDINQFSDLQIEYDCGTTSQDGGITLFPGVVTEDQINTKLGPTPDNWTIRTSAANCDELGFDISIPQGLMRLDKSGDTHWITVTIEWDYRPVGASTWTTGGSKAFSANSGNPIRWGTTWPVANGQYEVRMRRTTKDQEPGQGNTDQILNDDIWWSIFRSFTNQNPVNDPDAALIAIRIRASNQLNGVPNTINCIASAHIPDWTGSAWTVRATSNPASVMRSALTGNENARALATSRLNDTDWQAFHTYCASEGWEFNHVIDSNQTVQDVLQLVAMASRGRVVQVDGLWTAIIDEPVTRSAPPIYTPRNSWNFSATRLYPENVHAFRCRYISSNAGLYENDERIVYADGYDATNATNIEILNIVGVNNPDLIYRLGRYYLAVATLQPETFTFNVDAENIIVTPGDYIEYQDDAILVGSGAGRVKAFTGTGLDIGDTIQLDAAIELGVGTFGIQIRNKLNESEVIQVNESATTTDTFTLAQTVSVVYAVGDLAIVGELGKVTQPLLVKAIRPSSDLSASFECVPYNPALYTADTGPIPPYNPHITQPPGLQAPIITNIVSDETVLYRDTAGNLQPQAVLTIGFPQNRVNVASILVQYRIKPTGSNTTMPWTDLVPQPFDAVSVNIQSVSEGETYQFRASYIFRDGAHSPTSAIVEETIVGKTSRPPDLDYLNVTEGPDGTRYFDLGWNDPATAPLDLAGFDIRYADADLPNYIELEETGQRIDLEAGGGDPWLRMEQDTLNTLPPAWETMTKLRPVGLITEIPHESGSSPWSGNWIIGAKSVDTGGRESRNYIAVFQTLGLPRLGNTMAFRSDFNNAWGTADDPQISVLENCHIDTSSGYLVPDDVSTWATMGTWSNTPWANNPVAQMRYMSATFVLDPAATTVRWTIDPTYDSANSGTLDIAWSNEAVPDINNPAHWNTGFISGGNTTGNTITWRFTLDNPVNTGFLDIIYAAYDATGTLFLTQSAYGQSNKFNFIRRAA